MKIREAATLVLLRDGKAGLEAFMVQRNRKAAFSSGAHVFPGGVVEAADGDTTKFGLDPGTADARLNCSGGLRFSVAAIRETFEETGYLLARDERGQAPAWSAAQRAELEQLRSALSSGHLDFADWLNQQGLRLDCAALHYHAFWTTPPGESRRFSTRFFAAEAPAQQNPLHDGQETIAHCWIRPQQALEGYAANRFKLIFPTIKQLEFLSGFGDTRQAFAAMAAQPEIPEVRTRLRIENGRLIAAVLPGEPGYDELPAWD